jgi:streptomycin 6-kinase
MSLPKGLIQTINGHYGAAGAVWLERVPELIEACQDRCSLRVLEPFLQLSYHYVTRAVQSDDIQVVLKLGVPHRDFRMQVEALQAFDGYGCVKLLDADVDLGVVLLESVRPGDMLSDELDDSQPGDWSKRRFQRRGTMRTIDDLAIRTENTWN